MQKSFAYAQMSTELNHLALDHNISSNILSNVLGSDFWDSVMTENKEINFNELNSNINIKKNKPAPLY